MLLGQDSYRDYLNEELARRISANSRYSQRAFARHLKLSPGELSEILKGKRKLSLKSALKIVKALDLNQTEARHLAYLVQLEKSRDLGNEELLKVAKSRLGEFSEDKQLTMDRFKVVSDWYCFAILNLAETEGFKWSASFISKRLGISEAEVRTAVVRLERVGLLRKANGTLELTEQNGVSPDGIPSEAIRNYHKQILNKAIQALEFQPVHEREFAGIGFPMDPRDLPSIKKEINDFIEEIHAKYSATKVKKEVYHIELALFGLSRGEPNA